MSLGDEAAPGASKGALGDEENQRSEGAVLARMAPALDAHGRVDEAAFGPVEAARVQEGDWAGLCALYLEAARRAPDPDTARGYWLSAGLLEIEKLDSPKRAEPLLRRVLATDPAEMEALRPLLSAVAGAERQPEQARLLEAALEAADAERVPEIAFALVEGLVELDQTDRALSVLMTLHESFPELLEALDRARVILVNDGRVEEAVELLSRHAHLAIGPAFEAIDGAEGTLDLEGSPEATAEMAAAHRELGERLIAHAVHHPLARQLFERARRLGDGSALAGLDALTARAQEWEDIARQARDRGLESRDRLEAARAYLEAAQLHLVYGQDALRFEELMDRSRLLKPDLPEALRVVETIELGAGRGPALLERLHTLAEGIKDPEARARIELSAARCAEALFAEAEEAENEPAAEAAVASWVDALERARDALPEDRGIVSRLAGLLGQLGRTEARFEALAAYAAVCRDPDLSFEAQLELGHIAAEELGDPDRARAAFEAALGHRPEDLEAVGALRALLKDAGDTVSLLRVEEVLAELAPGYDARLSVLEERRAAAKTVGPEEAFRAGLAVFALDPDVDGLEDELSALGEQTEELSSLAEALAAAAERRAGALVSASEDEREGIRLRAAHLWRAAARLFDERLPRAERALASYRKALELDASEAAARDALERLAREADDPEALAELLRARLQATEDAAERSTHRVKLAEVLEQRLDRTDEAVEVLEAGLSENPDHLGTLGALAELLDRTERFERLESVLSRLELLAPGPEAARSHRARRAEILGAELDRLDDSAGVWLELLSEDRELALEPLEALLALGASKAPIARALAPIYAERGAHARRRDVLRILVATTDDSAERRSAALEAAALGAELGETDRALEDLLTAVEEAPEDTDALARVMKLAPEAEQADVVVDRLRALVERVPDPAVRAELWTAVGQLEATALDRMGTAIEAFEAALSLVPGSPAPLEALGRAFVAESRYADWAQMLASQRTAVEHPPRRAELGLVLAELREERLGDESGALDALREVLAEVPDEPTALSRLATRLPPADASEELVEVLVRLRGRTQDPHAAAGLDVRIGEVLRMHLDRKEEALERYARALEAGEREDAIIGLEALLEHAGLRARAGALLEPIHAGREDAAALARAIEAQSETDDTDEARRARAIRLARLRLDRLGDPSAAFSGLLEAYEAGVLALEDGELLTELAVRTEGASRLADAAKQRAESTRDPEQWRFFARLAAGEAARLEAARGAWESLLELAPGDEEALDALEKLTAAGDDPSALAEVLEARGESATTPEERARFFRRAGSIWEEAADRPERALEALQRARDELPSDLAIWQELSRTLAGLGRHAERADALHEEAVRTEAPAARARAFVTEAEARLGLDDDEGAVRCLERALEASPDHREARAALEELLEGPAGLRAALALEPVLRRAGDWARLASAYRVLAERSEDRQERVERWVAIRSIEEDRLGRLDEARTAAARAFAEAPERSDLLEGFVKVAVRGGRVDGLVSSILEVAETLSTPEAEEDRLRLLWASARLSDEHGLEPEEACAAWRAVAAAQPGHPEPLERLSAHLAEAGETTERADVIVRRAGLLAGAERAALLAEAGRLVEPSDPARATRLYEEALEGQPGLVEALDGLRRTRAEDEHGLAVALARAEAHLEGEERARALLELGRLRHDVLEEPEGALEAFAKVLEVSDAGENREAATHALTAFVEDSKADRPQLAARAALAVEPIWRERGAFHELIQAKEIRSEVADAADRAAIRKEIAEVYEHELGQPEMAFLTLGRAFLDAPEDEGICAELSGLAVRAQSVEEWAELNAEALGQAREPELRLVLARRAAQLHEHELGQASAAVRFHETVLELAPDDVAALHALERIHSASGDTRALVEVQRRFIEQTEDPQDLKARWRHVADLAEGDLDDVELTAEALGHLRRLDPEDLAILRRLSALAERSDQPAVAVEAMEAELARTPSPDAQAGLLLQIGGLRRDRLDDLAGAVDAFQRVLELRPDDPGAIAGLTAVLRAEASPAVEADAASVLAPTYLRHGAFEDYLDCLERVAGGREGEERKAAFIEIAETNELRLGRPERAFQAACRAFHEDPDDPASLARVERLATENGMLEDLAALFLDEADAAAREPTRALAYRRRVAEIYDSGLQDVDRAIAEYERVLDVAPGDPAALEALERLFGAAGRFERLAEIYRRRIAQTEAIEDRARLMRTFAQLQAEALDDAPGAIATLRRLVQLDPEDRAAQERLADLLEREGRGSELADVLERLTELDGTPEEQLNAKVRLGRVKAESLGDYLSADRLLGEALALDPTHPLAREYLQERFEDAVAEEDLALGRSTGEMLARALRASEEPAELVTVLQLRAGIEPRPADRVALELEIAQVQEGPLDQPDMAFATLCALAQTAPGFSAAREDLERLGQRLGREAELVEVYEASLEAAADTEVREQLERRIAQLLEPVDSARARDAWQRVYDRAPSDADALEALDRLESELSRWAALTDILERRAEVETDPEARHELWLRLGELWDERLSEPGEAIAAYRKARAERPRSRPALEALARLLDPETDAAELSETLERLVEQAPDDRARRRLEGRLATLCEGPLEDPERALGLWEGILAEEPAHADARRALERLYERTGRWPELAKLLETGIEEARDDQELLRMQRKLGLVRGARLGSVDEAVSSWQEILRRNPNDVEALEALAEVQRGASQWEPLVQTLRKLIPLQSSAEGVKPIRFELAEVLHERLGRTEDAIESAKRVLDVEPHTPAELMRLEELFTEAGAHGEAVRVKSLRAAQAESRGERIEILFEVAETYAQELERKAGAAAAYEQILQLEPGSTKAYEALAAIYEDNGDYRRLVELHDRRLDVVEDASERRALLMSIVDIQERWLGHPELAFGAACRAFAEEGADAEAQALAERLAAETDNWDLLVEVYEEQLDQVGAQRAMELRRRLGEIHLEQLGDPERAEQSFAMVLGMRPDDVEARARLRALHEDAGRYDELAALLEEQIELEKSPEPRRALLFDLARIHERQREAPDAAVACLERALDLEPVGESRALEELSRLFRTLERWRPLVHALERRRERSADPETRAALRFEMADVIEKGIQDRSAAEEAYRELLESAPGHRPTLDALERLYAQSEKWSELIEVYERRVEVAESPEEAIALLTQIAGIWEERFSDLDRASATLIRVLEVEPEHLPALVRLERIWRASGSHERLIEALERHVELSRSPDEATELLLEVGQVRGQALGDLEGAQRALEQALEVSPRSRPAVHALVELYEQLGAWLKALEMLSREIQLVGAEKEAADLHFRMGKIDEEMLGEREEAEAAYERALSMDPAHADALRALRGLRQEAGSYEEVIELEAREAEHTEDLEEKAALYHHAAITALDQLDDVERATRYLEGAVAAKPDHVPTLEVLSDLHFSEERWDEAEILLDRLVKKLDPTADRAALGRLYYRLAYIAEKHGEPRLALERYHASYEHDSTYLPTLEGLAGALLGAEQWEDAQRVFQAILIQHKAALTDAEVVDIHGQIGDLALKLDQLERARKSFDRALALDRGHVPTLGAKARLEEREEDWEAAYECRERLLGLLADEDERFEVLLEQARLSEEKIGEPWRAIDAYAEAKRLRPDDADVLRALVRLYRETSQVPKALDALNDLGLVLTEREGRRDVFLQMARIHREQQGNIPLAVQALNTALDIDPSHLEAFSTIEQMLGEVRAWPQLEENYHRMLARLPKEAKKSRTVLWRSLADLYVRALRNDQGARIAYEVLHRLEPDDQKVSLELAALYAADPAKRAEATELYLSLLPQVNDPATPARALFNLFFDVGMLDRSFCALGALVLMQAADETEAKAYEGLLRFVPTGPNRTLTDAMWRERLLHPHCQNELATLGSVLYRGAPALFGARQKSFALKPRRERVDLSDTRKNAPAKLRFYDVWSKLQRVMHVPAVEHYLRPQSADAPRFLAGEPGVLLCGQQNEVFQTASSRRIAFVIGRQLAASRPELALVSALDQEGAAACFEAAIRLFVPEGSGIDLGLDATEVATWQRALTRALGERARAALREPVLAVVEKRLMKVFARYLRGAEHSLNRAGLLASGDVAVAARALDQLEPLVPDVSHRARVRELMLFTLGADFFELREKLDAKVNPQAEAAVRQRP